MLMQNFGVTNKEHYGMLWYFLELAIGKCTHEPFPAKLILHTNYVALHAAALGLIRVFITSRGVSHDFLFFIIIIFFKSTLTFTTSSQNPCLQYSEVKNKRMDC